jgi:hypothetical protein
MKPLRIKLQDQANLMNAPAHVIEKDYALSYVLAAFFNNPGFSATLRDTSHN